MKQSEQKWERRKTHYRKQENSKLRWYGHIMRMEDCRIAGQVPKWNPHGDQSTYGKMGLGTASKAETSMFQSRTLEEKNYVAEKFL
jgi:hypothetical protein